MPIFVFPRYLCVFLLVHLSVPSPLLSLLRPFQEAEEEEVSETENSEEEGDEEWDRYGRHPMNFRACPRRPRAILEIGLRGGMRAGADEAASAANF